METRKDGKLGEAGTFPLQYRQQRQNGASCQEKLPLAWDHQACRFNLAEHTTLRSGCLARGSREREAESSIKHIVTDVTRIGKRLAVATLRAITESVRIVKVWKYQLVPMDTLGISGSI